MTFPSGEYWAIAGLGFAIVFAVLALLMAIITVMETVLKKKKAVATTEPAAPAASAELADGSCGGVKLNGVAPKTAAMLMAIVADETKTPLNELRFISIKELK